MVKCSKQGESGTWMAFFSIRRLTLIQSTKTNAAIKGRTTRRRPFRALPP
jgi:hypothetical protein